MKWRGYPISQSSWELAERLHEDVPDFVAAFEAQLKANDRMRMTRVERGITFPKRAGHSRTAAKVVSSNGLNQHHTACVGFLGPLGHWQVCTRPHFFVFVKLNTKSADSPRSCQLPVDKGVRREILPRAGIKYCVTRQWPLP